MKVHPAILFWVLVVFLAFDAYCFYRVVSSDSGNEALRWSCFSLAAYGAWRAVSAAVVPKKPE